MQNSSAVNLRRLLTGLGLALGLLTAAATEPEPDLEGPWLGRVVGPQGAEEIGFTFDRQPGGGYHFTLHFPVMNTYAAKFAVPVTGRDGVWSEPVFKSELRLAGDTISGTFGPARLPVELKRAGIPPAPPPAPRPPAAPAPRWSVPLGAPTWASPVAADGVVYVGDSAGKLHAVRAADGSPVWTWAGAHRLDGRAVVAGDALCFVDGRADLVCLARADGALRWRTPLHDARLAGGPVPDNPTFNRRTATPLVRDGIVYAGSSDGGLYALDAATGVKLWRHDAKEPVFSGVAADGDALLFGTMDGSVVELDRRTRREIRRARVGGAVVTTPLVAGDKVIVGGRDYMLYGLDRASGAVAWQHAYWFSWVESTPVLVDGLIHVGASDYRRVTVLDPASGAVRWATDVRGMNWGTPLVTVRTVYTGTVAQNLPGTVLEHTGGVMALDRATGAVRWQHRAPAAPEGQFGGSAGSLVLADSNVIAAGFDGMLTAWAVE